MEINDVGGVATINRVGGAGGLYYTVNINNNAGLMERGDTDSPHKLSPTLDRSSHGASWKCDDVTCSGPHAYHANLLILSSNIPLVF